MVAMLALLLGAIPGSVFASLFAPSKCEMPCCVGKPSHQPSDNLCQKGCASDAAHQKSSSTISESNGAGCDCSIRSAPEQPRPDVAVAPSSGISIQQIDADLAPQPIVVQFVAAVEKERFSFGSDSGPPTSGPNYVSLGRAPPVLLA